MLLLHPIPHYCTFRIPCSYPILTLYHVLILSLVCINRSMGSSDKESSCSLSSEKGHSHSSDERTKHKSYKSITSSSATTSYRRSTSNYYPNNNSPYFFFFSFYELIYMIGFLLALVCLSYAYIYKWDALRMSIRHGQEVFLLGKRVYHVTMQLILYLWNFTPNQEQ